jgi:hypothetical protein
MPPMMPPPAAAHAEPGQRHRERRVAELQPRPQVREAAGEVHLIAVGAGLLDAGHGDPALHREHADDLEARGHVGLEALAPTRRRHAGAALDDAHAGRRGDAGAGAEPHRRRGTGGGQG